VHKFTAVLKVSEKQLRELGSRIEERLTGSGQSARQISQSRSVHRPDSHGQFPMRLTGTPWSKYVLQVALTMVPVAFPIALAEDARRYSIRPASGYLSFGRLRFKKNWSLQLVLTWALG